MTKTVVHLITSLENGGAQEVLKTVCSDTGQDHRHMVFYMTGENAYTSSDTSLGSATALNVAGVYSLTRAIVQLLQFLKAAPAPFCIQGWMYQGNFLALVLKILSPSTPVLFSIHNGSDRWGYASLSGYFSSRICGLLSGLASASIFVSQLSMVKHVPYKNSRIIPNPLKPLKPAFGELDVSSHNGAAMVFACVARFDPIKNIDFMLDVIAELYRKGVPIRLLMAGNGMAADNQVLMQMIQKRNLEEIVDLLGVRKDISEVYAQADYTILTSKCESFSNVLLESIACGTPFVSSHVGIAEELLSPESVVVEGYDISDWVDRLQKVLHIRKTPKLSQSVRQHFDEVSETYAPMRIADLYACCWAKAIGP